jgi:uncharacterized protein with HEPN domain
LSRAYRDFLADILTHAQDAIACVDGFGVAEFAADRLRRLALERCFEIMGEAAGKLDPAIRKRYPKVPWAEMIAVRHRVAHAYFAVDVAILYRTARDLLPPLLPVLRQALDEVAAEETGNRN